MKRLILICLCLLLFPAIAFPTSSRQLPSSYNESTYGDATRDYTSLATWEAATDTDLVTATNGEVLTCYADSSAYNEANITFSGATTSTTYYRVIRAADGHEGRGSSGVIFSNAQYLDISESNFKWYDCQFRTLQSDYGVGVRFLTTTTNIKFVGCWLKGYNYSYNSQAYVKGGAVYFLNCYFTGGYSGNCKIYSENNATVIFNNCTIVNAYLGVYAIKAAGDLKLYFRNCIFQNNSVDVHKSGTPTVEDYTSCTYDDVTFDADGYHLDPTDTGAIDQGTDISSYGSNNYANDDIDGDTRSGTWDIGCDEYIPTYTLTYTAGANGSISGTSPQTVDHGSDGSAVSAVPDQGYVFAQWSDDSTDNPRTDTSVTDDISVTATFADSSDAGRIIQPIINNIVQPICQ